MDTLTADQKKEVIETADKISEIETQLGHEEKSEIMAVIDAFARGLSIGRHMAETGGES